MSSTSQAHVTPCYGQPPMYNVCVNTQCTLCQLCRHTPPSSFQKSHSKHSTLIYHARHSPILHPHSIFPCLYRTGLTPYCSTPPVLRCTMRSWRKKKCTGQYSKTRPPSTKWLQYCTAAHTITLEVAHGVILSKLFCTACKLFCTA